MYGRWAKIQTYSFKERFATRFKLDLNQDLKQDWNKGEQSRFNARSRHLCSVRARHLCSVRASASLARKMLFYELVQLRANRN